MRILSLSGFVPEQICDTVRFTQYAGDRNIAHYCGYVSDYISQVIHDDRIDGAVFPRSCDSTRTIGSYLSGTGKFLFQMMVPPIHTVQVRDYLATVIKSYKEKVERHYGVILDDTVQRIALVNQRNAIIKELYKNLGDLSFADYLSQIHQALTKPLSEQITIGGVKGADVSGKKVFLVGSFLSNPEIAVSIEKAGLSVIGDTLPESGRLASAKETAAAGDLYENIADYMLSMRLSPTQNSYADILNADREEMIRKGAQGILFVTQMYCEPYDYLFSAYQSMAQEMGVPVLKLSLSDTEDGGKAAISLEAFADTI